MHKKICFGDRSIHEILFCKETEILSQIFETLIQTLRNRTTVETWTLLATVVREVCERSDRVAFAVVGRDAQTRHRAKTVKSIRV